MSDVPFLHYIAAIRDEVIATLWWTPTASTHARYDGRRETTRWRWPSASAATSSAASRARRWASTSASSTRPRIQGATASSFRRNGFQAAGRVAARLETEEEMGS